MPYSRALILGLAALPLLAFHDEPAPTPPTPAPAETKAQTKEREPEAIVTLTDGQRYTGFIVSQNETAVVLRIGGNRGEPGAGIVTTIPRAQVDRIQILPPILERYRQMREAIPDTDGDRLVSIAQWAHQRGESEIALREVESLLERQPTHVEARRLRLLITSQRELEARARQRRLDRERQAARQATDDPGPEGSTAANDNPAAPPPGQPAPETGAEPAPLTEAQIDLIRVYEVNLAETPRVAISRQTIDAFFDAYAASPLIPSTERARDELAKKPGHHILALMFKLQAREFYPRVRVLDEPKPLRQFRDSIQRGMLASACATTACHGGADAGRLRFLSKNPVSDTTAATNMVILEQHRLADGTPLIDFDEPERSVFLQYALPRDQTPRPHPVVPNARGKGDLWRPALRSTADERYKEAVDWILSMYRPRPDYGLNRAPAAQPTAPETPPAEPPLRRASEPASEPSPEPAEDK